MAKIQNDKWYAWLLTPELRMLSTKQGLYYVSLDHKHVIAFDTKEEAAKKLKYYFEYGRSLHTCGRWCGCWWWQDDLKTRIGTGKELTVELVKRRLQS